ncbi:unnamed protein product [Moneuplotes crassus]|uniref:Uncharacterized protein n=1 Tax=Euplotes crassus TaxID=5936 RepID=A0AAD2DAZ9_EUPCR|nr:unnamed protein product [Moneuplotes crassus]
MNNKQKVESSASTSFVSACGDFDENSFLVEDIEICDLELDRVIGEGAWGTVWHAIDPITKISYAVKVVSKYSLLKNKQQEHAKREREIMPQLDHPFIVKLKKFSQDKRCIYFIQEFVNGGEFKTFVKRNRRLNKELYQGSFYAAQIAMTLSYLHSEGIIYRDLKPENMMMDQQGYLKLIDFGLSKKITGDGRSGKTMTMCGTPNYIAPEVILNKGYSFQADWWSFGVVLYEIFYGQMPFEGDTPFDLCKSIIKDKPNFSKKIDDKLNLLIKGLLRKDPRKRYGAKKILENKFFKDTDYKAIFTKDMEAPFRPSVESSNDTKYFKKIMFPKVNEANSPELHPREDIFKHW